MSELPASAYVTPVIKEDSIASWLFQFNLDFAIMVSQKQGNLIHHMTSRSLIHYLRFVAAVAALLTYVSSTTSSVFSQSPETSTVSGVVSDSTTHEVVIGATVTLTRPGKSGVGAIRRTFTNRFGFFSVPKVPAGSYTLTVSAVGYAPSVTQFEVADARNLRKNVRLVQSEITLAEVMIEAQPSPEGSVFPGETQLQPEVIKRLPTLGGEADVLRSVQLLPGVKSASELANGLYIRGGTPDQTLSLLDGFVLYDPTHLGGFLGVFNTDAVRDVKLVRGGFPAEYGQRLSSVLDVTLRDGTQERISGMAGLSTLNARMTLEGPLSERSSFIVAGRVMFWDLIYPLIPSLEDQQYSFWDANAKLNLQVSESDRLYLSGFFSRDILEQPPQTGEVWFDIGWKNGLANARWTHIFSSELFLSSSLAFTQYDFSARIVKGGTPVSFSDFITTSYIRDLNAQSAFQWFPAEDHTIRSGIEVIGHRFTLSAKDVGFSTSAETKGDTYEEAVEASVFLQDDWRPTPALGLNLGGRLYYYSNGEYVRAEPRLGASFALTDELSVKASAAMAHQFLHLIVRNDISVPSGVWFPATDVIRPARSVQSTLGLEANLFERSYLFTLEGYYKDLRDIYEYRDGADLVSNEPLEDQLTSGTGWAYGMEVFLNKRSGPLNGWIGYTLAWTKRKFAALNGGRPFYPTFDRRHDISILLAYRIDDHWEVSASWVYASGQAYSTPTGSYLFPGTEGVPTPGILVDFAERNAYRLPPFHKLDLAAMFNFRWLDLPWQIALNIYNVYNRQNVYAQYVSFEPSGSLQFQPVFNEVSLFEITPTIGISVRF